MDFSEVNFNIKEIGNWPRKIKIGVISILSVISMVLFWSFLIVDLNEDLERKESKEKSIKTTFESKQRKASQLKDYRGQYDEILSSLNSVIKQLPSSAEIPNLLTAISIIGKKNGLKFIHFEPKGRVNQDYYIIYPIKIKVVGKFIELGSFISDIAAIPRIVTIHDIVIKPTSKYSKDRSVEMEATIKTYSENKEPVKNKSKSRRKGRK